MNTEELTAIVNILNNLGTNASHEFALYLGVHFAESFIGYCIGGSTVLGIFVLCKSLINKLITPAEYHMIILRNKLHLGSGRLTRSESHRTCEALIKLIEDSRVLK